MNDMTSVIAPKSDQINADDLVGGPVTVVIDGVKITPGTEQPVTIKLRGEERVWRPCKTVSRLLVAAWGPDASKYGGRAATLYRDPKVKWGGMEVGGIRVSHLSHIEEPMRLALQETKGKRALTVVRPLEMATDRAPAATPEPTPTATEATPSARSLELQDAIRGATNVADLKAVMAAWNDEVAGWDDALIAAVVKLSKQRKAELSTPRDAPADEGPGY